MGRHSRKERGAPAAIVADQVQRFHEGRPYEGSARTYTPVASLPRLTGFRTLYRLRDGTEYTTDPHGAFIRLGTIPTPGSRS